MIGRGGLSLAVVLAASGVLANPRPLPFTYPYETLPKEGIELEQFVDLTPVVHLDAEGARSSSARYELTTELEYGITDRFELALYLVALTEPAEPGLVFDGVKERVRYRFADPGELPLDLSVYFEVAELHDELELELKLNLQKRLGPVRVMVNLWGERSFDYAGGGEWVVHPTAGITGELTPWLSLGAEYWMNWVVGEDVLHFAGPAVSVQWKRLWVTLAAYAHLDAIGQPAALDSKWGTYWVRGVMGLQL